MDHATGRVRTARSEWCDQYLYSGRRPRRHGPKKSSPEGSVDRPVGRCIDDACDGLRPNAKDYPADCTFPGSPANVQATSGT